MPTVTLSLHSIPERSQLRPCPVQESQGTGVPSLPFTTTPHLPTLPQTDHEAVATHIAAIAQMAKDVHKETVAAQDACSEVERAVVALAEEARGRYEALSYVAIELMHSRYVIYTCFGELKS